MTLPNHAVNAMYIGTRIIGSVILIIIAGPYVSHYLEFMLIDKMAAVVAGTALFMVLLQRFYVRAGRELRRLDLTSKSP
jgi:ATP-binding cassette subfamily C (CFTR/MRP) protein 1